MCTGGHYFFLGHIYIGWMKESCGFVEVQNEDLISKAKSCRDREIW